MVDRTPPEGEALYPDSTTISARCDSGADVGLYREDHSSRDHNCRPQRHSRCRFRPDPGSGIWFPIPFRHPAHPGLRPVDAFRGRRQWLRID